MTESLRIGLFGGSFDPIHHAHLATGRAAAQAFGLGRLLFLPASAPPHKGQVSLPEARGEMVRFAIADEPLFDFSDHDLRPGPTYAIDTVTHFRAAWPSARLFWIIGADWVSGLGGWRRAAELVDACEIVTVARPGWSPDLSPLGGSLSPEQISRIRGNILDAPGLDISSTEIRRLVASGHPIRHLVPERVADFIESRGLYQSV